MRMVDFCLGLSTGMALGILLAPRAGSKTRSMMRNSALDGVSYVKRRTDEVRDSAAELLKETSDKVVRETEGVKAAVMAGKRAYEKVVAT